MEAETPKQLQERIINELCDDLRSKMMQALPRMPEHWNGLQVREWLADEAQSYRVYTGRERSPAKRAYLQDCINHNL